MLSTKCNNDTSLNIREHIEEINDSVQEELDNFEDTIDNIKESVNETISDTLESIEEKLEDHLEEAEEQLEEQLEDHKEKVKGSIYLIRILSYVAVISVGVAIIAIVFICWKYCIIASKLTSAANMARDAKGMVDVFFARLMPGKSNNPQSATYNKEEEKVGLRLGVGKTKAHSDPNLNF